MTYSITYRTRRGHGFCCVQRTAHDLRGLRLEDTTAALGTDGYWRLRLGIGHPRELYAGHKEVAAFVLERPSREQQESIDLAIDRALAIVPLLVGGAIERAAQRLHTKAKPNTAQAPKNAQPSHNTDLA